MIINYTFFEGPSLMMMGFIFISNDSIRILCCSSSSFLSPLQSLTQHEVNVLPEAGQPEPHLLQGRRPPLLLLQLGVHG